MSILQKLEEAQKLRTIMNQYDWAMAASEGDRAMEGEHIEELLASRLFTVVDGVVTKMSPLQAAHAQIAEAMRRNTNVIPGNFLLFEEQLRKSYPKVTLTFRPWFLLVSYNDRREHRRLIRDVDRVSPTFIEYTTTMFCKDVHIMQAMVEAMPHVRMDLHGGELQSCPPQKRFTLHYVMPKGTVIPEPLQKKTGHYVFDENVPLALALAALPVGAKMHAYDKGHLFWYETSYLYSWKKQIEEFEVNSYMAVPRDYYTKYFADWAAHFGHTMSPLQGNALVLIYAPRADTAAN